MATFARYELPDGGEVYFETPDTSLVTPRGGESTILEKGRLADQVDNIAKAASIAASSFRRLMNPDELELQFGVSVTGAANWWFIVSAKTEGSIRVTLKWKTLETSEKKEDG